ncbi:MAG: hypothetical protein II165_07235 [Bacteroidales bacterium]|nr:hypothetical protein [Bacteroidales bacterium]
MKAFDYVRNFFAALGVLVVLYFARSGSAIDAIQIYMIGFPISVISDAVTTVLNITIYGT